MAEKQQHTNPTFWIISAISVAVYLFVIPAVIYPICSAERHGKVISGQFTIQSQQQESGTQQPARKDPKTPSIAPIVISQAAVKQSAHGAYYPAREPERAWWVGILCEVNLSDFLVGLFTLILAISTIGLWAQTERLAAGADDQADKMAQSIAAAAEANKISATGQRAWIKIESAKLISPIDIPNLDGRDPTSDEARTVRLIIQVALRNTGHSAASQLKVSCRLEGIPEELFPFVPDQLREFGERIWSVRSEGGSVLLPGDPEIRTFEYSGPMPHYSFQDSQSPHLIVGLEVCATYRISTDTDIHQTQFAYREPVAITSLTATSEINLTRDGTRESAPT
jgi:hypothetical protein